MVSLKLLSHTPRTYSCRFPPLLRIFAPIPRVTLGRPFHARLASKLAGAANDRNMAKGGVAAP